MLCPDCQGKREIVLFTSVVKCERCAGCGQVGDKRTLDIHFKPDAGEGDLYIPAVFDPEAPPPEYMLPRMLAIDPRCRAEKNDLYVMLYGGLIHAKAAEDFLKLDLGTNYISARRLAKKYYPKLREINDGQA